MKINVFKKERVFKKGGFHTNPDISWEIVLYISFALMAASFVFGFFLFKEIDKEFIPGNTMRTKILDKEKVDATLDYFAEREKRSSGIVNSPSPVVDPSI